MNSLHNPSLEGNSIVGRKRTKNMMGQHTLDLMGISGCWAGPFQPFPLPEPQAVVLCWDVFACQLSAVVFTGSVSKHLHPEAVLNIFKGTSRGDFNGVRGWQENHFPRGANSLFQEKKLKKTHETAFGSCNPDDRGVLAERTRSSASFIMFRNGTVSPTDTQETLSVSEAVVKGPFGCV